MKKTIFLIAIAIAGFLFGRHQQNRVRIAWVDGAISGAEACNMSRRGASDEEITYKLAKDFSDFLNDRGSND